MDKYEKLNPFTYGMDLQYGEITQKTGYFYTFYYIVNNTNHSDVIKDEALNMMLTFGRSYFHFCGKYQKQWHLAFDQAKKSLYGDSEYAAVTVGYDNWEEMVDIIEKEMSVRTFIPREIYIIYDDIEAYEELKRFLRKNK